MTSSDEFERAYQQAKTRLDWPDDETAQPYVSGFTLGYVDVIACVLDLRYIAEEHRAAVWEGWVAGRMSWHGLALQRRSKARVALVSVRLSGEDLLSAEVRDALQTLHRFSETLVTFH